MDFLHLKILDLIDILLVAYLLYRLFLLLRGTIALKITAAIFVTYLFWVLTRALNMKLISNILGQVMGVGVIALIVVFQQEIRKFLLFIGNRYFSNPRFSLEKLFSRYFKKSNPRQVNVPAIVSSCIRLAEKRTGALIVIAQNARFSNYVETGELLMANTSARLLDTIFFKNSPLHDGAVIIEKDRIVAAGCVLPVSQDQSIPSHLGLRHRAALGMSETSDSVVIIVSEETGFISYARLGKLTLDVSPAQLEQLLFSLLQSTHQEAKSHSHEKP